MGSNRTINLPSAGPLFDRLRMGGKKTAVAGGLVVVMLLMWVRVFVGPRSAAAAPAPAQATATRPQPASVPVEFVELPQLPGRQDSLERDFFTITNPAYFRRPAAGRKTGTETEVPAVAQNDPQEVVQRVAKTLKLKAVLWSESPRALINDRLLCVGDTLTVKDNTAALIFEVLQIYVDSVLMRCGDLRVTLPLALSLEGTH